MSGRKRFKMDKGQSSGTNKRCEDCCRRVLAYKEELSGSESYTTFCDILKTAIDSFKSHSASASSSNGIGSIVCYGLGSLTKRGNTYSRYQLALLLLIKEFVGVSSVFAYDPDFTELDWKILSHFNCIAIEENEQCKRKVEEPTLFYMPRCDVALYNNLMWANWNPEHLSNVIVIGNSFKDIVSDTHLLYFSKYISEINSVVEEYPVPNNFPLDGIFSGSIHIFNKDKMNELSEDFWEDHEEPIYSRGKDIKSKGD